MRKPRPLAGHKLYRATEGVPLSELGQELMARVSATITGEESPDERALASELEALPEEELSRILTDIAHQQQERTLSLFGTLVENSSDGKLAGAVAESLSVVKNNAAVDLLAEIATTAEEAQVRKTARASLQRMKSSGMEVDSVLADHMATLQAQILQLDSTAFMTLMSGISDNGDVVAFFARRLPLKGLVAAQVTINDVSGIAQCNVHAATKKAVNRMLEGLNEGESALLVPVDPEYAQFLLAQALQKTQQQGKDLPEGFEDAHPVIGETHQAFEQPPLEEYLDESATREHLGDLLPESLNLVKDMVFGGWGFLDEELVKPFVERIEEALQSEIVISEQASRDRVRALVQEAIETIVDSKRDLLKRRIEHNAYILACRGALNEAETAWAVALALQDPDRSPTRIPLLAGIVSASLRERLKAEEEAESLWQVEEGSGILVPRQQPLFVAEAEDESPTGIITTV